MEGTVTFPRPRFARPRFGLIRFCRELSAHDKARREGSRAPGGGIQAKVQGRSSTKKLCGKHVGELVGEPFGAICLKKPLLGNALDLFRQFLGAVCAMIWFCEPCFGPRNGERKKTKDIKNCGGKPLVCVCVCVPSVPRTCPIRPVIHPVCPADILPLELEFPHKSAQTSRVSLGRPEFFPGTLHQILYVIFL